VLLCRCSDSVSLSRAQTGLRGKSWLTVTTSLGVVLMVVGVIEAEWTLAAIAALGIFMGAVGLLRAYRGA
jgi:hypothetical protein